uniref:Phosphatidic acid phosphatase type 2/haloperoxidase domain-containing protein n=1 Tax=Ascaris suum TaxID=6253 RepID=F1L8H7_ASCSU
MNGEEQKTLQSTKINVAKIGGGEGTMINAASISHDDTSSNRKRSLRAKFQLIGPAFSDIIICIIIGLIFTILPAFALQPYRRGFFCADETIRYPYKHSTVTTIELYIILLSMPILTIIATEVFRIITLSRSEPIMSTLVNKSCDLTVRFITFFAHCFFGLLLTFALTQTTKLAVGRLRPHFIDVCKPNITLTSCSNPYVYILDYECQGGTERLVKEARLSFFSGHSALSMDVAVFCVIYMQARLPRRIYGVTVLPVLQASLLGIALLIGLSRISDYKHHWSDVVVGFLVGSAIGYYSAVILGKVFERSDAKLQVESKIGAAETRPEDTTRPLSFVSPMAASLATPPIATQVPHQQSNDIITNNPHHNSS